MNDVISDLIETYNEYIRKIPSGCIYIAHELQRGNKMVMGDISNFAEGLEWIILVSEKLNKSNVETNLNVDYIMNLLKEANEAILREDLVLLADLFEYEISEYFKSIV